MWTTKLKAAIATHDINTMVSLIKDLPEFESHEQMQEASYLIKAAIELVQTEQNTLAKQMEQTRKNIAFLKSTQTKPATKHLDIST